jgi:histone H3/H4
MTDGVDNVAAIIHDAREKLRTVAPAPFTESAFRVLQDTIDEFISDLMDESFRIAKRHKSEVVSANYVQAAGTYLVASRARRFYRHMGTVGGILLGGSLSNILAMAQSGTTFPMVGTLVSVAVGLIGSFLVAVHIAKD